MTKEEFVDFLEDEAVQETLYNLLDNISAELFGVGEVQTEYNTIDPKTHKVVRRYHTRSIIEVLAGIESALYEIADSL